MGRNGIGPQYIGAVQEFCDKYNITQTTGHELSLLIGYTPLRCTRALKLLCWDRSRKSSNHRWLFTRNGHYKSIRRDKNGKLILRRFEEHYFGVLANGRTEQIIC